MKSWKRILILPVCLLSLAAGPGLVPHLKAEAKEPAQAVSSPYTGATAPDFELTDYNGKKYHLSAFHGKPVLLNFWASWCEPCRMEMPDLAAAGDHYKGKVQFVGVNLAGQDSEAVSQAMLKRLSVHYPNLLDRNDQVADLYKVSVLPTSLLLDANGKVIARIQGPLTQEQMKALFHRVGF